MKLRNKKTGEVFDALIREKGGGGSYSLIVCDIKAYEQSKSTLDATHFVLDEYSSLADLNEEWEDYKPAEPLIEDEKICKIVRVWANENTLKHLTAHYKWGEGTALENCGAKITFYRDFNLKNGEEYTVDELCGEEEE